jgi:hypothetical protein
VFKQALLFIVQLLLQLATRPLSGGCWWGSGQVSAGCIVADEAASRRPAVEVV